MKGTILFTAILLTADLIYGHPNGRIIGGSDAAEGAAPHLVSLRSIANIHFCAGSIVTRRSIVTAARCLADESSTENIIVVAGTNSLTSGGTIYRIKDVKIHPSYHQGYRFNDMAIAILDEDIIFTSLVQPIALRSFVVGANETVTLTGWGTTTISGPVSDTLQTVDLETISVYSCQGAMVTINWINESQLCTLTNSGKGACNGDFGGSVTLDGELVGVASYSVPCVQGFPDVHSRISSFIEWIQDNII